MSDPQVNVKFGGNTAGLSAAANEAIAKLQQFDRTAKSTSISLDGLDRSAAASRKTIAAAAAEMQGLGAKAGGAVSNVNAFRKAMDGVGEGHGSIATATRESRALFDELSSGRTRQTPGTLAILANRVFGLQGAALAGAGAVAALGFALFEAAKNAEEFNEHLGGIQAALDATGKGSQTNSGEITQLIYSFRDLPGVSTEAAQAMTASMARMRDLGVRSFQDLGYAVVGFARASGTEPEKAMQQLEAALEGGYGAIRKLDEAWQFLTPAQAEQLRQLDAQHDKYGEVQAAVAALTAKFKPLITDGLTQVQVKANEAGKELDDLFARLAGRPKTPAIAQLESDLADLETRARRLQEIGRQGLLPDVDAQIRQKQDALARAMAEGIVGQNAGPKGEDPNEKIKRAQDDADRLRGSADQRKSIEADIAVLIETEKKAAGEYKATLDEQIAALKEKDQALKAQGGQNQYQQLQDGLDRMLAHQHAYGEAAKQIELDYWKSKRSLAEAGSAEQMQIDRQIYSLESELNAKRITDAKRVAEAQKQAARDQWEDYSEGIRQQIEAATGNFDRQIALAQQWVASGQALYGKDVKNYKAALEEKARLSRERDKDRADAGKIGLKSQIDVSAIINKASRPAKSQDSILADLFGIGDPKAALQSQLDDLKATYEANRHDEWASYVNADTETQQATILAEMNKNYAEYIVKTQELNRDAAANYRKDWEDALEPIGRAFSTTINGIIQGTQSAGLGLAKLGQSILLSGMDRLVQGGLKLGGDQLAGLFGNGPGGVLTSLLGLGGSGKDAANTQQVTAVNQNTNAIQQLTAAMQTQLPATQTNTDATNLANTGSLSSAAATIENTGLLGQNTTASQALNAIVEVNNIVTEANTIATEAGGWAKLLPFAGGGRPPTGIPSIVGEKGPELFVPDGAGTIIPNHQLGSWGLPSFGQPRIAANGNGGWGGGSGGVSASFSPTVNMAGGGRMNRGDVEAMLREHSGTFERFITNYARNRRR